MTHEALALSSGIAPVYLLDTTQYQAVGVTDNRNELAQILKKKRTTNARSFGKVTRLQYIPEHTNDLKNRDRTTSIIP